MSTREQHGDGPVRDERDGRVDLGGPVHYVDFGGRADGPTFVLVHGLGGSHLNWELFAPQLTPTGRVLALDLPGFGLSEPGERPATVPANTRVLETFLRRARAEARRLRRMSCSRSSRPRCPRIWSPGPSRSSRSGPTWPGSTTRSCPPPGP